MGPNTASDDQSPPVHHCTVHYGMKLACIRTMMHWEHARWRWHPTVRWHATWVAVRIHPRAMSPHPYTMGVSVVSDLV